MNSLKVALTGLLATLLVVPAFAMESPAEPTASEEPVEEITVVGQRTLLALRLQVEQAQDEVHLLFNDLNTDNDFDIICKHEERYFSRMRQKNCMPQYAWDARAKDGRLYAQRHTGELTAEGPPPDLEIEYNEIELREQMVEAVRHSPELFDAIVKHAQLLEKLDAAQTMYFGNDETD